MARAGQVQAGLLADLLAEPYYQMAPPKTTGRELFGDAYGAGVVDHAEAMGAGPADVVATLTALTARSIADAYARFGPAAGIDEVIVAGGGARNPVLLNMLRAALPPGVPIALHDAYGLPAKAKEATVFALLGYAGLHGCPGTLPSCTGATRPAIPGAITPGINYRRLLARVAATPMEELCPIQSLRLIS
jgi:anhydro-N-acetylmuramic acid kinase